MSEIEGKKLVKVMKENMDIPKNERNVLRKIDFNDFQ